MVLTLKKDTNVVLVFDTDVEQCEKLKENISFLEKQPMVKKVICIPQVKNLEDELIRSCEIRQIKELLSSRSNTDFKRDLCKSKCLHNNLKRHNFDIQKFWSKKPTGVFAHIPNDSTEIKK